MVDERLAVAGRAVTDLTHLFAELTENAVRFSPPEHGRHDPRPADAARGRGQLLTVEDWGVGMTEPELAAANALLADPPEVDLSVSKRLGFHVVARLASRHGIRVVLSPTPGSGITASITLPGSLFELGPRAGRRAGSRRSRCRPPDRAGRCRVVGPTSPVPELDPAGPHRDRAEHATAEPDTAWTGPPAGADRPGDGPTRRPRRARTGRLRQAPTFDPAPASGRPHPGDGGSERVESGHCGFRAARPSTTVRTSARSPRPPAALARGDRRPRRAAKPPEPGHPGGRGGGQEPIRTVRARRRADGTTATTATPAGLGGPRRRRRNGRRRAGSGPTRRLRRRVPQAHLAPGLRIVPPGAEPVDPAPLPVAAEALSRYQASRAAPGPPSTGRRERGGRRAERPMSAPSNAGGGSRLDWLLVDFARGTPGCWPPSWSRWTGCRSRSRPA